MKKILFYLCISLITLNVCNSQVKNISVNSRILEETRQLKLQIPRNYDPDSKKTYPLIIVFDGDYLFEPVAGIVDYLSYWEEIPDAFVVGINQAGKRIDDGKYDNKDLLPFGPGARFFDFVQLEVMDYLKDNYNLGSFKIAVGHDYMANFINFFLFSEKMKFQGYINLSPDIHPDLGQYIKQALNESKSQIWYSLTTGSNDLEFLKEKTTKLYNEFSEIENELITVSYKLFEDTNHYTFVVNALPFSLTKMFTPYTPIDDNEYANKLSKAESPVEYLVKKYENINALYDVNEPIRIADIMTVSKYITENESWENYQDLAKVARKEHSKTLLYDYFLGRYFQEMGQPKKAIKAYQSAYTYEEAGGITKDMAIERAKELKEIFGY